MTARPVTSRLTRRIAKRVASARVAIVCALMILAVVAGGTARATASDDVTFEGLDVVAAEIRGFGRDASEDADAGRPRLFAGATNALGHWRFVNSEGRQVTARGPEEVAAAFRWMAPTGPSVREDEPVGVLLVPLTTAQSSPAVLRQIPDRLTLAAFVGDRHVPIVLARDGRVFARAARRILVPLGDADLAEELLWHLRRPFGPRPLTVLSVTSASGVAGAQADSTGSDAHADAAVRVRHVDPLGLSDAFADSHGALVLTGAADGDGLRVREASDTDSDAADQELPGVIALDWLAALSARHRRPLLAIDTGSVAQPGATTHLWQERTLSGFSDAMAEPSLARVLDALAGGVPLVVRPQPATASDVVAFSVVAEPSLASLVRGSLLDDLGSVASGLWSEVVAATTGDLVARGFRLVLPSREAVREAQLQIIPGIPGTAQIAYLALLALGLVGLLPAWHWWHGVVGARWALIGIPIFVAVVLPVGGPIWLAVQVRRWLAGAPAQSPATARGPNEPSPNADAAD